MNGIVLHDGQRAWSAGELSTAVRATQLALRYTGTRVLATLLDNGAAVTVLDEAAAGAGIVHVPLPPFFTPDQIRHALHTAGVDTLVAAPAAAAAWPILPWQDIEVAGQSLNVARLPAHGLSMPAGTAKITYTSGSTGAPKGVCLRLAAMERVADGVVQALGPLGITRHLSVLPFAVLLENVAGQMAARRQGALLITPPLAELGWQGSSQFDVATFHAAVLRHAPDSMILLPQMLRAWVGLLRQTGQRAPAGLKFVAVGGAAVGAPLIAAAQALGIPAYEGYGLSEGASVQTLNLPGAQQPGSVGRPLPHARLRVAADGEIEVAGSLFAGYLGDATPAPEWWPSGDLGHIDANGHVHIQGRKKNLLISAYGRNISPEWVETALGSQPVVRQAVVFGDGEPSLWAVLWPLQDNLPDAALQAAVDAANAALPDYARVARWTRGRGAFSAQTGYATANGRPQRAAILHAHGDMRALHPETLTS
ncbi:AMP-binding protein [Hylemonella gracilis]|uniref:Long-chain acyl-CoA synthetase n=1 Tax=Hylemonella gracilis ATCC 19624 TaxID=887062 RepID=F3KUK1_9BURK|nr:AMP-binding protein [Hylemonella gracilis]EGI76578.1 long-chain acyl-CoA synthetase [Hylemonella gracilis ATCC 19624]